MCDLSFRDWRVVFGVLPNPIMNLPFAIVIDGGTLSVVSGRVQAVRENGLDTGSWAIEYSR
jgi:hypothetical protein